jgi:elongation factor P
MPKQNANTLRAGNIIEHNDKLYMVVGSEVSKPGKGGAYANITMRDVRTGNKDVQRFRTQESVERVRLDQDDCQFLFNDGEQYTFMDTQTYEQFEINGDIIGYPKVFLQDGMVVTVEKYEEEPLNVQLPDTVVMEVVECEPVVKGQTASSSYKPGQLENGERVMIPPHINAETRIVIKTEDGSYVERAKD